MESTDRDSLIKADRNQALLHWLTVDCGLSTHTLQAMEGAASFRRYFRIYSGKTSWVVMDAPPLYENCRPYIAIAKALRRLQLHTPEIIASDVEQGFLLLTDFGETTYLKGLKPENADNLYGSALHALSILQGCREISDHSLPLFSSNVMRQEWRWCKEWFLNKLLKLTLSPYEEALDACFEKIITSVLQQPQVFMHRDFHSGNLMVLPKQAVGILDFQDAFIGPLTYDLVSLLRDCYIDWPKERVHQWVYTYKEQLAEQGFLQTIERETFLQWFDWMGVERHWKTLFTFARKTLRDGEAHYLAYVPRTLQYLMDETKPYPELSPMHEYVSSIVLPAFLKVTKPCAL